jgi:macrodomain Ter protein organizer (MatP/YcbG family)
MADDKAVHIRMPHALWEAIAAEAKKRGQTASSEIRGLLYDHYGQMVETKEVHP